MRALSDVTRNACGRPARVREAAGRTDVHRLAVAIRATIGIESLVWLTDVAGLSPEDAVELMRANARALLRAAA